MQRITITLDDDLLEQFDAFMDRQSYGNRSEAFRDLLRARLESERLNRGEAENCIGCLTYIYNHHERELSRRLTQAQHDHHDLALSTLHVHLDHDNCLEAVVLRGKTAAVKGFGAAVMAERGVRHGNLHVVPTEVTLDHHHHHHHSHETDHVLGEGEPGASGHFHSSPKT